MVYQLLMFLRGQLGSQSFQIEGQLIGHKFDHKENRINILKTICKSQTNPLNCQRCDVKFIFSVSLVFTPISKYHRACLYLYFKGIKQWIFGFGSSKFGILRYHLNQTHIQVHLSFSTSESTCYHFFRSGSHLRLIY